MVRRAAIEHAPRNQPALLAGRRPTLFFADAVCEAAVTAVCPRAIYFRDVVIATIPARVEVDLPALLGELVSLRRRRIDGAVESRPRSILVIGIRIGVGVGSAGVRPEGGIAAGAAADVGERASSSLPSPPPRELCCAPRAGAGAGAARGRSRGACVVCHNAAHLVGCRRL